MAELRRGSRTAGVRLFGVTDAEGAKRACATDTSLAVVDVRELHAITRATPYVSSAPSDAELEEYLRIVDAVSDTAPIVPAAPGTVFRSAKVLREWMELHYSALHDALEEIEARPHERPYDYVRLQLGV